MLKSCFIAAVLAAVVLATHLAEASHFRGAAMVPEITADGRLRVTTTTFWRKGASENPSILATSSSGSLTNQGVVTQVFDTSDSRFDRRVSVQTWAIGGVGPRTINLTWNSCCRVAAHANANWVESSWTMNSRLVWNGSGPTKPIDFNFGSVQSQVNRNSFYSQNLNATSSQTLTYNQNLNESITAQPTPGFAINPSTGLMTISALETPLIVDNPNSLNAGADKAFSGNIIAADGSFVEFDWMLDGVSGATNQAPVIMDAVASGAPGALFTHTFSVSDPNGNPVTFDPGFFDILGPASAIAPVFNSSNGTFTWDSTGSVAGTYIFQVRARDPGNLTDVGQITVTLAENAVPEPSTFIVMAGLMTFVGGSAVRHRRKSAQQR